jgi:hypothetical protein
MHPIPDLFHPAAHPAAGRTPSSATRRRPRRSLPARLACTAALLTLATLAACADDLTGPVRQHAIPRAAEAAAEIGQFAIPIPATSYKSEVPWTNSGIVVPRTGRYKLRVQGVVTAAANPAWPGTCTGASPIEQANLGDWGPAGRFPNNGIDQPLRVRIFTGPVSSFHPGFNYTKIDDRTIETEVDLTAGSAVWVHRQELLGYVYCGEGTETAMYVLSGSQILTVSEMADATLECKGPNGSTTLERGQTVRCVARSSKPFRVLTRQATATGLTLSESPNTSHTAGTEHVWEGPAVASTQVQMVVEVTDNGATRQNTYSASFTVTPRNWPKLTLSAPSVTVGLRGRMQAYPSNGVLGNARPFIPVATMNALPVTRPATGPNTGLAFLKDPLPAVSHSIYIHPALTNSPSTPPTPAQTWRMDQDGSPSGTCTQSMFGILTPFVNRHEGVTQASNSHWGITARFYRDTDVEQRFEELTGNVTEEVLRRSAGTLFASVHNTGAHKTQQDAFDTSDYATINTALGCLVDNNPSDT